MNSESDNPLFQIIVDIILALNVVDDDIVDTDFAVNQLESIAFELKRLSSDELVDFLQFVETRAIQEHAGNGETDVYRFLVELPKSLGLIDE